MSLWNWRVSANGAASSFLGRISSWRPVFADGRAGNRLPGGNPGRFLRGGGEFFVQPAGGESSLRRAGGALRRRMTPFPSVDGLTPSRHLDYNFFSRSRLRFSVK